MDWIRGKTEQAARRCGRRGDVKGQRVVERERERGREGGGLRVDRSCRHGQNRQEEKQGVELRWQRGRRRWGMRRVKQHCRKEGGYSGMEGVERARVEAVRSVDWCCTSCSKRGRSSTLAAGVSSAASHRHLIKDVCERRTNVVADNMFKT